MKYTDIPMLYKGAGYIEPDEREAIIQDSSYGQAPIMDRDTGRMYVSLDPNAYAEQARRYYDAVYSDLYDSKMHGIDVNNKANKTTDTKPSYEEWMAGKGRSSDDIYNQALEEANRYVDYRPPFNSVQELYNYSPTEARTRYKQWEDDLDKMPEDIVSALYPDYNMRPTYDLFGADEDVVDMKPYYDINGYMASDMPIETEEDVRALYDWLQGRSVSEEALPVSRDSDNFEEFRSRVQDYMQRNVYDKFKPAEPPDVRQITPQKIVMGNDLQRLYAQEQSGPRKLDTTYLPSLANGTLTMGSFGAQPKQQVGTPAPQFKQPGQAAPTPVQRQPVGRDHTAFGDKPSYVNVQNQRNMLAQQPR